jgi:hypothetical protein
VGSSHPGIFECVPDGKLQSGSGVTVFKGLSLTSSGPVDLLVPRSAVWDTFAAEFANKFFSAFLSNCSAGRSLLGAKRALLAKKNPLGLVYTLHASADLHLVPRLAGV